MTWCPSPLSEGTAPHPTASPLMTDKQLKRLAAANDWTLARRGKHEIWRRGTTEQITIPYRPNPQTAKLIARRLVAA